jgi:CPA2 family monovalent cation:H+ antiporter-2
MLGVSLPAALILGGTVSMSSTAITLKQLADQGEVSSEHGRLAMGILLFQDIATLPFLVVIGAWNQQNGPEALTIVTQLALAGIALGVAAFVCRPVFRAALTGVARMNSPDLFLLAVLMLALGTAFVGHLVGLASTIGAFLAGMVVGESDFRHQVEDDIRPFRDVLLGLFFVTVGMEVTPSIILFAPLSVLAWLLVFMPVKALLAFLIGWFMRWPTPAGSRVAVILAHGGEFGLLLLTQATHVGAMEPDVGQPALLALVTSMALGPILILHNGWITRLFGGASHRLRAATEETAIREESRDLDGHVLLCGCGRVGRLVAVVLEAAKIPYIAVESNLTHFRRAKTSGHKIVFGDASRQRVLEAAGVSRSRLLVITFDQQRTIERLLHNARRENPSVPSIISVSESPGTAALATVGATIFPENLAAGLGLADQVLLYCGFSQDNAANVVTAVRTELNPELEGHVGI